MCRHHPPVWRHISAKTSFRVVGGPTRIAQTIGAGLPNRLSVEAIETQSLIDKLASSLITTIRVEPRKETVLKALDKSVSPPGRVS